MTSKNLQHENEDLRRRLAEAEEALAAIREGEVDAVVVEGAAGPQVFSLAGAERVYRVLIETMNEAALTIGLDGTILFCNRRFLELLRVGEMEVLGKNLEEFAPEESRDELAGLLATVREAPVQRRFVLQATDATQVPVQLSANMLQAGDGPSICIVAADLTELEASYRSLSDLREHQRQMEQVQAELRASHAAALNLMEDALTARNDAQRAAADLKQSEEALRHQKAVLDAIMHSTDVQLVYLDRDFNFIAVNAAYAAACRKTADELIGRNHFSLYPHAENEAIFRRVRDTGEPAFYKDKPFEFPDQPERGVTYWDWSLVPVKDAQGRTEGLVFTLRETTKRKKAEMALEQSEQRLRLALQAGGMGTWDWDVASGECVWSDEYYRILGHEPGSVEPSCQAWAQCVHPEDRQAVEAALQKSMAEGTDYMAEYRTVCPKGKVRWVEARGRCDYDRRRKPVRSYGVMVDITDRKAAEEAMRSAKEYLEVRVRQRTAELSRTVDTLQEEVTRRRKAEEALRVRGEQLRALAAEVTMTEQRERQRLAQVLHDGLQQILVGAKFRLESLARGKDDAVRAAAEEISSHLSDAIETSRNLTADLSPPILFQAGLQAGLEWLTRWMQEKHSFAVKLEAEEDLGALPEDVSILLFQATKELLFNAVKHAGVRRARVAVSRQGNMLEVIVSDEGAGFGPAHLRFEGGPSKGFGLFSIRERLELLGGHLEIDSAPGRGSRFTMQVPLTVAEQAPAAPPLPIVPVAAPPPAAATPRGKIRVVLVDDHVVMRQGLSALLHSQRDMAVIGQASNGQAALELLGHVQPDVVLMDVSMPVMDGIEATAKIHAQRPDVAIIGLSMFEEPEQARAMRQAGAMDYQVKSGPAEKLVAAVRKAAGGIEARQSRNEKNRAGLQ